MRGSTGTTRLILASAVMAAGAVWAGSATLFINFPSISPNGDGVRDEMTVTVELSSQVDTLLVTVDDQAAPVVYDTLIFETPAPPGISTAVWGGTDWNGAVLPEGAYSLVLRESTGGTVEEITRTVVIDLTPPQVNIDRIEPGVFAPGWPDSTASVTVYFTVSLWESGASARMIMRDPSENESVHPLDIQGVGEERWEWKPASAESGFHLFTIVADDEAGNSDADSGSVYVDSDGPQIGILTSIPSNTREVPPEITGNAWDRSSVAVLQLSWAGPDMVESGRFDPDSTWMSADTLYWRFDTPDTVNGEAGYVEGGYVLKVFSRDAFDNATDEQMSFRLDRTPPAAPRIADLPGKMIQRDLDLFVEYDDDTDSLFVYRYAGGVTDTTMFITAGLTAGEPLEFTLSEGLNEFRARGADKAGNMSPSSNTVSTTFDPATGITYPEVFRGPGSFQVVSARTASSVTVEIYDLRGERITKLVGQGPGTSFEIPWDLTTDDGEMVNNGPCLVVITIDGGDGSRSVEKAFIAVVR